jgi:excisionase family DNA binding protein
MNQSLLTQDRLLTFEEVRAFLNVSGSTLRRWIKAGKLKFHRLGRQLRFQPGTVVSSIKEREGQKR